MSPFAITTAALAMGIIALISYVITFSSQIIQLRRTRNSSGTSLWTYIIYEITAICWLIWAYGFYFNSRLWGSEVDPLFKQWSILPITIADTLSFVFMTIILCIKIYYLSLAKNKHISEMELASILLKQDKRNGKAKKALFYSLVFGILAIIAVVVGVLLLKFAPFQSSKTSDEQWVWVAIINWIAAGTSELINWPQFIKSVRTKNTVGISFWWSLFLFLCAFVFMAYNLLLGFAASDGFTTLTLGAIVLGGYIPTTGVFIIKARNMANAKKLGMTELEYTKKKLIKKI